MTKVFVVLMFFVLVGLASAKIDGSILSKAGTLPDQPTYWLDKAFEKIQLAFTKNETAKAELIISNIQERFAEQTVMVDKMNFHFFNQTQNDIDKAHEDLNKLNVTLDVKLKVLDLFQEQKTRLINLRNELQASDRNSDVAKGLDKAITNQEVKLSRFKQRFIND